MCRCPPCLACPSAGRQSFGHPHVGCNKWPTGAVHLLYSYIEMHRAMLFGIPQTFQPKAPCLGTRRGCSRAKYLVYTWSSQQVHSQPYHSPHALKIVFTQASQPSQGLRGFASPNHTSWDTTLVLPRTPSKTATGLIHLGALQGQDPVNSLMASSCLRAYPFKLLEGKAMKTISFL